MSENTKKNTNPSVITEFDSVFKIDDVYTVQRDNVPTTFLSGYILKGTLHNGEGIVVYNEEGKPVLTCKITGIERIGRESFEEITFEENAGMDNAYGIWVDNDNADLFKPGHNITSLVNGKNKKNADRLTEERISEILNILANNDRDGLRFLSIQELCALLRKLDKDNDESENDIREFISSLLYKKISDAEEIYMTIDETTKQPFFNSGLVDIYSVKSYAEDAVDFYGKQFRKLQVVTANQKTMSVKPFVWLTLLGMKQITVDNGQHHVTLDVERFLTDEDKKSTLIENSPAHPPFYNPEFRNAMNTALSELRWPVNYPHRKENCEAKDTKMWEEFNKSHLLLTIKQNNDDAVNKGQVAIPHINNGNNEEFIALFTDLDEMQKLYKLDDWGMMIVGPAQALELDDNVGIVINPMSENLVIPKEKLADFREKILSGKSPNAPEATTKA